MNPEPEKTKESVEGDQKTHDLLPAKTKELLQLQDQAQKASGPDEVAITKEIAEKSK